jgi:hypothetical protein
MKCSQSNISIIWEDSTDVKSSENIVAPQIFENNLIEIIAFKIRGKTDEITEDWHYPLSFIEKVRESKNRIRTMSLEQRKELAKLAFGSWENEDYFDNDRPYDVTTKTNNVISF